MSDRLSDQQLLRYSRQMILSSFPDYGQETLRDAKVLVVGMGGLGCTVSNLLVRAGVGHLGLVDPDSVDLSNLHRQLLFDEDDIGRPKVHVAAEKLSYANSDALIEQYHATINDVPYQDWMLVLDCCDNRLARHVTAAYAAHIRAALITASAQGFGGHLTTLLPQQAPSIDDIYPVVDEQIDSPSALGQCEQMGIIGPTVVMMASLMAQESLKYLLSIGQGTHGKLLLWDGLNLNIQNIDF